MNEKLSQTIDTLSLMSQLSSRSVAVALYDDSINVVYSDDNGVSSNVSADNSIIRKVMNSRASDRVICEGEGCNYECNYVPVIEQGNVVGCIFTKVAIKNNDVAMEKAESFMNCIDQINNSIEMMSIHFENLFDKLQSMKEKTGFISEGVEETSAVVSKIRANASKSKILALNASIEAARSGEAGRGFTVVAKEMGEMATASGTSASDINDALQSIFGHLEEITTSITDANELAEKQTSSINEIEEYLGAALNTAMELGQALQE